MTEKGTTSCKGGETRVILSVSRRTDVPCLYPAWFMNRIRAGFALVRNPMNPAQLSRVPLNPDVVDCIVFWTKDAGPMLPWLPELDRLGYRYYFQFTLTPYGRDIEPSLRPKRQIVDTFIELSRQVGRERVVWRYDPILLNDTYDVNANKTAFLCLCDHLAPYTDTVIVSFVDLYAKLGKAPFRAPDAGEREELARFIAETAGTHGLTAAACCEADDLTRYGVSRGSCIDQARIERICGCPLESRTDRNQRKGCGCSESIDIGAYNTCVNGCAYCYANAGKEAAKWRFAAHDPASPLLCGSVSPAETIRERAVRSLLVRQTSFLRG